MFGILILILLLLGFVDKQWAIILLLALIATEVHTPKTAMPQTQAEDPWPKKLPPLDWRAGAIFIGAILVVALAVAVLH